MHRRFPSHPYSHTRACLYLGISVFLDMSVLGNAHTWSCLYLDISILEHACTWACPCLSISIFGHVYIWLCPYLDVSLIARILYAFHLQVGQRPARRQAGGFEKDGRRIPIARSRETRFSRIENAMFAEA